MIVSVDRTKPIGKLVGEYGDRRWMFGFIVGYISGSIVATICLIKR
jgi:hypothetical protein